MSKVKSYEIQLDLECDALVLDIFNHLLASIKDDHSPLLLAHIRSILVGILNEVNDLLLELLFSIVSRCESRDNNISCTTHVISQRVWDTCASWIPLQQIISSIDEIMQVKENEVKEGPNDKSSVEFKGVDA